MSLTFINPQTVVPPPHLKTPPAPRETLTPMEVSSSVAGPTVVGGITFAAMAVAAIGRRSHGQRRGSPIEVRAFENELGVQAPVGFFDPLGLAKDGDANTFNRRRESELKHGRISMLAAMGYITPELFRLDGFLSPTLRLTFADVPNGLKALSVVPPAGWFQIILYMSFVEVSGISERQDVNYAKPGNFGFKNLTSDDPQELKRKLNAELANGRLAMMAIIGMFFQDGLTGSAWGNWELYTDSPLRGASAFESELGVQAPVGFFDPLGLAKDGDVDTFNRRRESELKHGRISMLAAMGYITPELFRLDGFLSPTLRLTFSDVPNGLKALSVVPPSGWFQIILYMSFVEVSGISERQDVNYAKPGNFGFRNLTSDDPEELKRKLSAELANGRLAMMAIIGMFFQDGLTGSAWGSWDLYTDSPLRGASAFENELGVQAPVGFFDPLGLAKDGDVDTFNRRRESELKHGRISMLAAMGYITPELFRLDGLLSPSLRLTFADVPNGLKALSVVPPAGWFQIILYMSFVEVSGISERQDVNYATPGNFGFKKLTSDDPEELKRKLNAELANGRLAMMAIIGMFFQDGLTGSAWGSWDLYIDSPLHGAPSA